VCDCVEIDLQDKHNAPKQNKTEQAKEANNHTCTNKHAQTILLLCKHLYIFCIFQTNKQTITQSHKQLNNNNNNNKRTNVTQIPKGKEQPG